MKIPTKFTIGKHTYKVEVHKHIPGTDSMGQIKYNQRIVQIATHSTYNSKPHPKREVIDTFWHEVTHAILKDMGHDLESNERFVNAFADRLTDVVVSAKL
jgi:hypothetical protein